MRLQVVFVCCFLCLQLVISLDIPCQEKFMGKPCLMDGECTGEASRCVGGKCECREGFDLHRVDDGDDPEDALYVCKIGGKKNAKCTLTFGCEAPLICRSGKCRCPSNNPRCTINCGSGRELVGSQCLKVAQLGQHCDSRTTCSDAFAECSNNRCRCASGTRQSGRVCSAKCPDGRSVGVKCWRLHRNDADMLAHESRLDTCSEGYQCVIYGKADVGHCCRVDCPYGYRHSSKSCEAGLHKNDNRFCSPETHYCHHLETPGWKVSLCCPRPCREPTPLYIKDKCLPVAHYEEACETSAQCEGGGSMRCVRGKCACVRGFVRRGQSCVRQCAAGQVRVGDGCDEVGDSCASSSQCSSNAFCYYGQCECLCGFTLSFGRCVDLDNDPLGLGSGLDFFSQILGRNS